MKCITLPILLLITLSCYAQKELPDGMKLIPGGEYSMGKASEYNANYSPAHTVKIDSFLMDEHEVTNAQYLKFCETTGYKLPEFWNVDIFHCGDKFPNHPVVGISWNDALKYAEWAGKRLPTEAEWEYAARGGLADNDFPNGNSWDIPLRRNETVGIWENQTVACGSFEANGYGLFDMAGNVWEWVMDTYQRDYYSMSPTDNPKGPLEPGNKVIRGGSWHSGKMCHKVFYRKGLIGNWVDFAVGFRCAMDI